MELIEKALTRGVAKILPAKEGLEKLISKKKIKLYQGFDPTGKLHLGHAVGLRKLMQFAELGHEVIFLFGTGTVLVGDPSQRDSKRKKITQAEIEENIKYWKNQANSFVDFSKVKILENGDWLNKLNFQEIINLASKISAIQLFKRKSFQRRLKRGDTVWYHETMYPVLQGYDSVVMDVDLEIGGTDQEFNMLIGRELQKKINKKEKYVLTFPMILGTDGMQMSKSSDNCIWLDDPPEQMYGKLMSIPDSQLDLYIEVLTDLPLNLSSKESPLDAKKEMAFEVVKQAHGEDMAAKAGSKFENTYQKRSFPVDAPTVTVAQNTDLLGTISKASGASISQSNRWIQEGAVDVQGNVIYEPDYNIKSGDEIKIGKKQFYKVKKR